MREIRTSGSEGRGWKRTYGSRTERRRESEGTDAPDPTRTAPPPDPTTIRLAGDLTDAFRAEGQYGAEYRVVMVGYGVERRARRGVRGGGGLR